MRVKSLKPSTAGNRHQVNTQKFMLSKTNRLLKAKMAFKKKCKGRSSIHGKITAWHRGGGKKLLIRQIDCDEKNKVGLVISVQYDPVKTAFTSLNFDLIKKRFYNETATNSILPGMISNFEINDPELRLGLRTRIKNIPLGSFINSIAENQTKTPKYVKSAGTFAELIKLDEKYAHIKLPSNKVLKTSNESYATVGIVSNLQHNKTQLGKAGRKRNSGRRPIVRGIAMNPVDHPHGGRTNGGKPSVTPWGLPTKSGFSLKKKKKNVNKIK